MNNNTLKMYPNQATSLEDLINCKEMYIHNGIFHMDDVMCVALMISLQEKEKGPDFGFYGKNKIEIHRDRDNIPLDTTAAIMDILGGYFDHHNRDIINYRDNDPEKGMASMGCLMEVIGERVFGNNSKEVDEKVIMSFDLADIGKKRDFVSSNFCKLNPLNSDNMDECFEKALRYAKDIVEACQNDFISEKDVKSFIDIPEGISLESMLSQKLGEKRAIDFAEEITKKDSTFNYIICRMNNEKAKDFVNDMLSIEIMDYQNKLIMDKTIKKTLENLDENSDYVVFDYYPGDVDLSDSNIKYIIFPQTGTSSYCISTVTEDIKIEGGFPPSKLRFPAELNGINIENGKPNPIRDDLKISRDVPFSEINSVNSVLKFRLQDVLNTNDNNLDNLKNLAKNNEKALNIIKNFNERSEEFENLEEKVALINEFTKRGVEFIHPVGFFAQADSKESAINFVKEVLYDKKFEKHRKDWAREVENIKKSVLENDSSVEL